jgi:alpha-aminoadipate carrier protein LysW
MISADCISCGAEIKISAQLRMGLPVTCPDCDAELEVVWLDPVELDWPFDEEDYEDDEEYYYEEENF